MSLWLGWSKQRTVLLWVSLLWSWRVQDGWIGREVELWQRFGLGWVLLILLGGKVLHLGEWLGKDLQFVGWVRPEARDPLDFKDRVILFSLNYDWNDLLSFPLTHKVLSAPLAGTFKSFPEVFGQKVLSLKWLVWLFLHQAGIVQRIVNCLKRFFINFGEVLQPLSRLSVLGKSERLAKGQQV